MQQAVRTGIRTLRSSILSHYFTVASPATYAISERGTVLGFIGGSRVLSSQSAACSLANFLEKGEVTTRVVDLLKSIPFVDPAKVSPTANFKDDLQLDTLDNVEVMMAVEEEFAVDIPDSEANKFSTTAHLIDYIATHPQAK